MPDRVANLANRLIADQLDPVPRQLLMTRVLGMPGDDPEVLRVHQEALDHSVQIRSLLGKQKDDGSFGRFNLIIDHDKLSGGANEMALYRAQSLGLANDHPMMTALRHYLENQLDALKTRKEQPTDRWPWASRLVLSALLSELGSQHPDIAELREIWKRVVEKNFGNLPEMLNGQTEPTIDFFDGHDHMWPAEWRQLKFSIYQLVLLADHLPFELEKKMMQYLFEYARGIFPVSIRSMRYHPLVFESRETLRYVQSIEILNRFSASSPYLLKAGEWLWEQLGQNGLWDLGPNAIKDPQLPLSDSWKSIATRQKDCTVRMLLILSNIQLSCDLYQSVCHTI